MIIIKACLVKEVKDCFQLFLKMEDYLERNNKKETEINKGLFTNKIDNMYEKENKEKKIRM
jgi:hypothetical protein